MISIPKERIVPVNSQTYIDQLGVGIGLDRLPGEKSDLFAERIELAASASRGAEYAGLMNELSLQLGLDMFPAVHISSASNFTCSATFGLLTISSDLENVAIALLTRSSDDFWQWKSIAAVVAEINSSAHIQASLLRDGPALQLVEQSNVGFALAEPLDGGKSVSLAHGILLAGSETFSDSVPSYVIGQDGRSLHFSIPVPDGLRITYRYRRCPYDLVASPAAAVSLLDPALISLAGGANGTVIHQVREYLQEVLKRDGSYWGK